jgi:hypothetical protein
VGYNFLGRCPYFQHRQAAVCYALCIQLVGTWQTIREWTLASEVATGENSILTRKEQLEGHELSYLRAIGLCSPSRTHRTIYISVPF